MGGIDGIAARGALVQFATNAAVAGAVGAATGMTIAELRGQGSKVLGEDEPRPVGSSALSDAWSDNVDGTVRLGMGAAAVLTLPVALAAAKLSGGRAAAGVLGIGAGLAGAALLSGGSGGVRERVDTNLASAGSALNARIHAAFLTSSPTVHDSAPKPPGRHDEPEARPTAAELRAAKLPFPGPVDHAAAERQARATLDRLDFTKRDLVVWAPGTNDHGLPEDFQKAVLRQFGDRASVVNIDYPASMDFGPSVATGMETLRLVLAGIAERGGDHRVLLGGHSQGSWVIGEAMADPTVHAVVDRASIFANPGPASHHYANRKDPKVLEVNDAHDPITFPVAEPELLVDGVEQSLSPGTVHKVLGWSSLVEVAAQNPRQAAYLAARYLEPERWRGDADPHHYQELFPDGATWLDTGSAPASAPTHPK